MIALKPIPATHYLLDRDPYDSEVFHVYLVRAVPNSRGCLDETLHLFTLAGADLEKVSRWVDATTKFPVRVNLSLTPDREVSAEEWRDHLSEERGREKRWAEHDRREAELDAQLSREAGSEVGNAG